MTLDDELHKLLGLPAEEAESRLRALGVEPVRREYSSKRGIEDADSERVIRLRPLGNNRVEMLVSRFKTLLGTQKAKSFLGHNHGVPDKS